MSQAFRTVFITGANRGIGLELVTQLLDASTPPQLIFASCRNPSKADALKELVAHAKKTRVEILQLDILKDQEIEDAVRFVTHTVREDGLDLLINNSGYFHKDEPYSWQGENLVEHFRVNCVGAVAVTKAFESLLEQAAKNKASEQKHSAVVMITSAMGSIANRDSNRAPGYSISKPESKIPFPAIGTWIHLADNVVLPFEVAGDRLSVAHQAALNMASKLLSVELKKKGISVNPVHPGWVKTDMGGPDGLLTTQESVQNIVQLLPKLSLEQTGVFFRYNGEILPW